MGEQVLRQRAEPAGVDARHLGGGRRVDREAVRAQPRRERRRRRRRCDAPAGAGGGRRIAPVIEKAALDHPEPVHRVFRSLTRRPAAKPRVCRTASRSASSRSASSARIALACATWCTGSSGRPAARAMPASAFSSRDGRPGHPARCGKRLRKAAASRQSVGEDDGSASTARPSPPSAACALAQLLPGRDEIGPARAAGRACSTALRAVGVVEVEDRGLHRARSTRRALAGCSSLPSILVGRPSWLSTTQAVARSCRSGIVVA